jgi:hypothetical protein
MRDSAETLGEFVHPPRALYVFGPEDGSLDRGLLAACHRFVQIPSRSCLNLAAAVNVVLYDRARAYPRALTPPSATPAVTSAPPSTTEDANGPSTPGRNRAPRPPHRRHLGRERRLYRAEMPASARGPEGEIERRRRKTALGDIAAGLRRHLGDPEIPGDRAAWTEWAARLVAGEDRPAPDGSTWLIRTVVEFT